MDAASIKLNVRELIEQNKNPAEAGVSWMLPVAGMTRLCNLRSHLKREREADESD
jgi:hypothetical protein